MGPPLVTKKDDLQDTTKRSKSSTEIRENWKNVCRKEGRNQKQGGISERTEEEEKRGVFSSTPMHQRVSRPCVSRVFPSLLFFVSSRNLLCHLPISTPLFCWPFSFFWRRAKKTYREIGVLIRFRVVFDVFCCFEARGVAGHALLAFFLVYADVVHAHDGRELDG